MYRESVLYPRSCFISQSPIHKITLVVASAAKSIDTAEIYFILLENSDQIFTTIPAKPLQFYHLIL